MSAQHTPGPWEIDFGYNRIINFIGPCVPNQYAGSAWLEVTEADARLIAAAPDLLEALRKLHHALDECAMVHDDQRSAYANASAAIAKAGGAA